MKTSQIVIAIYLLLTISIYGQKEGNIWYFGNKAGLDFNSGSPVALTNGQMNAFEGCATISDSQGNLLFYTDGIFVWDKTHNQMPNGYGLFGDPSASQSGVIVPAPGSNTIYYIFSVPAFATGGFYYSVADLSLNGGLGDITQKNIPLLPLVSEKVTAVLHQNGNDIWIITHGMNDLYYAYLLSVSGLNPIPVESVGIYDLGYSGCGNSQGYLKASPDGKLLAMAISFCSTSGRIELAEFDNQSGIITPFLTDNISGAYGVEFSPNCKLLYASGWYCKDNLYQYRLDAGTTADILASKTMIAAPSIICDFSALQIGPDKKVYVGNQDYSYISVIHNPDDTGAACNFELNAISLSGKYCRLGLPTFIQSYFVPGFNVINVCFNDTAWFHYTDSIVCDSLQWCFGDSASGNNYSSTTDAFHIYSAPGIYTVTLHVFSDGIAHESYQEIFIGTIPVLTGFHDTIICAGTSYIPDICSFNADSYLWNTGDTLPVITVQQEGTYVLDAYNECGNVCDSFMVGFNYPPEIIFP
ncbi:MAG: PKD domain-containing protein, partial [Bacteroidota bacterium]